MTTRPPSLVSKLISTLAILQVVAFLGMAIARVTPFAIEPWRSHSMSLFQMAIYLGWVVFNAYAEGYRGFQRGYAPRVVGRAVHLGENPKPLHVVLALPFCMGLFHAQRRRKIVAWCLVIGISGLVIAVKRLPQPWRGIVDGGVVVGLAWGVAAVLVLFARYLAGHVHPRANDLPTSPTPPASSTPSPTAA